MKIYRPLKSDWKTQGFRESLACAKTIGGRLKIPTHIIGKIGNFCPAGFKDFYKLIGLNSHNGTDNACWIGEPIYFPVDADCKWWARNEIDQDGGIGLDVFSDRPIDIGKLPEECGKLAKADFKKYKGKVYVKFRFWHLSKSLVSDSRNNVTGKPKGYRDTKVKFGDLIALGGNTGASSGSHLHWSMKIVANNSMTLDINNGWYGAVDFVKYYENEFVGDVLLIKEKALTTIELARKVVFATQQFIRNLIKK